MTQDDLAPFLHYAGGNKVGGILIALVCFGIGALGFVDATASDAVKLGLAIPFGIVGLLMLVVAFRPATRHPAIVALRDRANEIVWVYPSTQKVNGVPSQTFVHFGLEDGSTKALAIGARNDPAPLLERARRALPHATVGYSPELEARFKTNASALRAA